MKLLEIWEAATDNPLSVVAVTWIVRRMRPMAKAGKMLAEMTSFMIIDSGLFEVRPIMLLLSNLRKASYFEFIVLACGCCLLIDGGYEGVNLPK
jgi:hypothetical protein